MKAGDKVRDSKGQERTIESVDGDIVWYAKDGLMPPKDRFEPERPARKYFR